MNETEARDGEQGRVIEQGLACGFRIQHFESNVHRNRFTRRNFDICSRMREEALNGKGICLSATTIHGETYAHDGPVMTGHASHSDRSNEAGASPTPNHAPRQPITPIPHPHQQTHLFNPQQAPTPQPNTTPTKNSNQTLLLYLDSPSPPQP